MPINNDLQDSLSLLVAVHGITSNRQRENAKSSGDTMSEARLAPSIELNRRVIDAATAYTISRMKILERIPGNPVGIAYRKAGEATALSAQNLPSPFFNGVIGLRAGQANEIEPLVEWYRGRGQAARFEIAAGDHDPSLGRELARLGFFQSGYHAALIREIEPPLSAPPGISVEPVLTPADMEDFLSAYVAGHGVPDAIQAQFKANVRPWLGEPGWSLYLIRVDGRPVATAILFVHAGVGYFADAATDPPFRRRGLHSALLNRRLQDARATGAEFVCSGADFLSTSHRNMERAGMRLLFLRAIWTPLA
jgi:GNAT superfamily N-acetyltransferase